MCPKEIAPGVESMQLQFGVDDNGDETIDAYRSAASVDHWENVRSVLIELTVRAGDFRRANEPVGDAGHDPNERQGIAQVFTTACQPEKRAFGALSTCHLLLQTCANEAMKTRAPSRHGSADQFSS